MDDLRGTAVSFRISVAAESSARFDHAANRSGQSNVRRPAGFTSVSRQTYPQDVSLEVHPHSVLTLSLVDIGEESH